MTAGPPLVYLSLKLKGLEETLGLREDQILRVGDEPGAEERARVRVLVAAGAIHLPIELVESFPNLAVIVSIAAGHDGIDLDHARARGIQVTSSMGANAPDVADLAVGALVALVRGIVAGDRLIREGRWQKLRVVPTRSIGALKVGIVGLGMIGQEIARRMEAFGCAVEWFGPRPKQVPWPRVDSLLELATRSDALFVAAHLSAETQGMVDARAIAALGPGGFLVNVGRGPLVDEDALIAALRDGRIGGAALDVFEEEATPVERWRDVPNTVLTPHLGGATHEALQRVFERTRDSVHRALAGEPALWRAA